MFAGSEDGARPALVAAYYDAFHRPDLVRRKLAGEDIRPYIGDLTIDKALQNPPPHVAFGSAPVTSASARLKIPYAITSDKGDLLTFDH